MTPRQDVCIDYDKIPVYATISIRKSEISRIDKAKKRSARMRRSRRWSELLRNTAVALEFCKQNALFVESSKIDVKSKKMQNKHDCFQTRFVLHLLRIRFHVINYHLIDGISTPRSSGTSSIINNMWYLTECIIVNGSNTIWYGYSICICVSFKCILTNTLYT